MLTKIKAMLSSSDLSNVKLGVTLLESLYPAEYTVLASEWQPWADVFGATVADTIARNGFGEIDCSGMGLRAIPAMPKTVQVLDCSRNRLTALPDLPAVQVLHCWSNHLTELPDLPSVQRLYCWSNQLTELPDLPSVQRLDCSNNRLKNRRAILKLYPFAKM